MQPVGVSPFSSLSIAEPPSSAPSSTSSSTVTTSAMASSRFQSIKLAKDLPLSPRTVDEGKEAEAFAAIGTPVHALSSRSDLSTTQRASIGWPLHPSGTGTSSSSSASSTTSPTASPRGPRPILLTSSMSVSSSILPSSTSTSPLASPIARTRQPEVASIPVLRSASSARDTNANAAAESTNPPRSASSSPVPPAQRQRLLAPTSASSLPPRTPIVHARSSAGAASGPHERLLSSPSLSSWPVSQSPLMSISPLRFSSATSSPVSAASSPCHSPPRLLTSSSRRSSFSWAAAEASRATVLGSQELLFAVLDFVEYTQLFSLMRVCQRWHQRLGGRSSRQPAQLIPSSYSLDFQSTGNIEALVQAKRSALTAGKGHRNRRSLVHRLMAKLACSEPTSPTDDRQSTNRIRGESTRDDSAVRARTTATSPRGALTPSRAADVLLLLPLRNSSKHFDYFLRRSSASLSSLPTSAVHRSLLLKRLRHVRHLRFTRRAERRLDGEWVAALIDSLSHSSTTLQSLALCGCRDVLEFGVCADEPPLLTSAFLSAHAISHQKKKPVAISDSSFALLLCSSTTSACFSSLMSLSLANCSHLSDSAFQLLGTFPALRQLNLSHCIQLSDDTLESIVRHNNALQSLNLSGCRSLTNATPYYLSSFLSASLTDLNLSGCGLINDQGVSHVSTLHQLRFLQMRALEFITDKSVVSLIACNSITALDVADCPFISNKALALLSLHLPLESLNLQGCTLLNDRGVHYIASSRHQHKEQREQQPIQPSSMEDEAAAEQKANDGEERSLGLIPASELLNIAGLDDEEEDSAWMLSSRAASRTSSPASTPRLTSQRPPFRIPALPNGGVSPSPRSSSSFRFPLGASPLRHLSLAKCSNLTDQAVRQLSTYSPLLQSLDLSGCSQLTDASVMLLAKSMTALHTLLLSGCSRLTDTALLSLSGMRLQRLHLNSLTQITEDGIAQLCQSTQLASSLRALSLSDVPRLSDSAVHSVATTFSALHSLCLSYCPVLTDQSLFHLSVFLPNLSELACAGCEGFSDDGFARILRMRRMENVDVSHCRRLSSAALTKVTRPARSAAEKAKDDKAQRAREKRRQKEKEDMVRRGELREEDFEDEPVGEASDASVSLSDSLSLLVIRGCSKISEQTVESVRKAYKRLKIVH